MELPLLNSSLFARAPPSSIVNFTLDQLNADIDAQKPLSSLIDLTYHLLRDPLVGLENKRKLWKIRWTLLLFGNMLPVAKREAVNLNNALYDLENQSITETNTPKVNPLPKNNNGLIDHELLVLILRLKSTPNMNLVNEFYKLSYQLRLRSSLADRETLLWRLSRISFDVVVVLVVNKAYSTLVNLLGSILHELKLTKKGDHYTKHASNVTLLWIIAGCLLKLSTTKGSTYLDEITKVYGTYYDGLLDSTKEALLMVLSEVAPLIQNSKPPLEDHQYDVSLEQLGRFIQDGSITSRTICSLLGIWDLQYCYRFQLKDAKLVADEIKGGMNNSINLAERKVEKMWSSNYSRVYGLE